jgi:2-iminoacetate synthase
MKILEIMPLSLGITSMSAGSKTDPGGYASPQQNLEQFEISDDRSPAYNCCHDSI